jgi:diguanylate cyclase (GGDEF)-like protein
MNRPTDTLTGLISGAELNADIDALIKSGGMFSLALMDIDNLFNLNRDYGNEAGDEVFRLIGNAIRAVFPAPCAGYRVRGDEIIVSLPGYGKERTFLLAEALRKAVNEAKLDFSSADGTPLTQSVSIGVSSYPDDGSRAADLLRRADSAIMRAKKEGRNTVCLAREEKLMPKTSHYTQTQLEKLSLISDKINVGESALLREALDDLLRKYDIDEVIHGSWTTNVDSPKQPMHG